jgi:tetratricopeptide (TPR) repeat protein
MTRNHRRIVLALLAACGVAAVAAATPQAAEDLIRQANAAFLGDDLAAADRFYAAAEERTADPGLVAFNRAAVLFQKGEFRDAELQYARVLDDRACPPDRAARAWFNRGTCLVRRGGPAAVYRSAIACFERCLDSDAADDPLKADARHNLELAKLLWAEANRRAAKPETPNEHPPPEEQQQDPPAPRGGTEPEPGGTEQGGPEAGPNPRQAPQPLPGQSPDGKRNETDKAQAGNNANLPVLRDEPRPQPLSPEDTREYLRRIDGRLKKQRQELADVTRGPDRPAARDW